MMRSAWGNLLLTSILCLLAGCRSDPPGVRCGRVLCEPGEVCDEATQTCLPPEAEAEPDAGWTCSPACTEARECVAGVCVPRYTSLRLIAPSGGTTSPGSTVIAAAVLDRAPGRTVDPQAKVTAVVTSPDGSEHPFELQNAGTDFEGPVTVGTAEGDYVLVAKYAAGDLTSAPVTLRVDQTGPVFTVTVPAAPIRKSPDPDVMVADPDSAYATAYKLNETVVVHVSSPDKDVDRASVVLTARAINGQQKTLTLEEATDCGGEAGYCAKAALKLWELDVPAFQNPVTFRAWGKDQSGNPGSPGAAFTTVTRFKWVRRVDSTSLRASPAIADDGTLIVGSTNGTTAGKLQAVKPDGSLLWEETTLGALESSPAIGTDHNGTTYVYAARNGWNPAVGTSATLYALKLADGAPAAACTPPQGGSASVSIALSSTQHSGEATATETGTVAAGFFLMSVRPWAQEVCPVTTVSARGQFPGTVIAAGADAFFPDERRNVQGLHFEPGGWVEKNGWPVQMPSRISGIAVSNTSIVGALESESPTLFSIPAAGLGASWTFAANASATSPVAIGKELFAGLLDGRLARVAVGGTANLAAGTGAVILTAPLLGEGGHLYTAASDGSVTDRLQSAPDTPRWSVSGLGTLESSPNIDCTRDATGTRVSGPGVLYVASDTGKLYAFLVDSKGIDPSAPWPKYQHDPRNTGNADTSLSEFICPQ